MTTDGFCELNLGNGGCIMDETIVSYAVPPLERLRSRIQIAGCLPDQLADVLDVDPCTLPTPQWGLVTRNIPCGTQDVAIMPAGDTIAVFGEVTGIPNGVISSTLASHTVSAGKTFHLIGFVATGNVPACFIAYISSSPFAFLPSERILMGRTSVAQPTIQVSTEMATPTGNAGDIIDIRVEHSVSSLPIGALTEFQVTLLGYEV